MLRHVQLEISHTALLPLRCRVNGLPPTGAQISLVKDGVQLTTGKVCGVVFGVAEQNQVCMNGGLLIVRMQHYLHLSGCSDLIKYIYYGRLSVNMV